MHMVNLMSIAFADGEITDDERDILIRIAKEMGLTEAEYNSCVDYWKITDEENIAIAIPESDEEQIEYLKHFALVMMIDGQITDKEKGYLVHIADKFGYDPEELLPALIDDVYHEYFEEEESDENIEVVFVVRPDGKATIYEIEKEDWGKMANFIGAKRLAPLRIDTLDELGKNAGLGDHLVAWTDLDAPRKGLGQNIIASSFFPGVIAGDIVFSLADNLYDPMPFFDIEEAERAIDAIGATLEGVVTDMVDLCVPQRDMVNLCVPQRDYSKINPFVDKGYVARIEPDGNAYIVDTSNAVFALFEEDIYDPARLDSLNELGKKLGIKGRLTIWTDNAAYRKQMVMYDKVKLNSVGCSIFPGPVVDNFYLALEDNDFRLSVFNNLEHLKKALSAIGIETSITHNP